jgi:flagellar biosynthesis/type III secretory pathway protein FliH
MEDLFKDTFIDRFLEEGRQLGIERGMQQGMEQGMQQGMEQGMQQGMEQGKQQGRADSATRVLLTILTARGIAIADQVRTRIAECADPDLLERWATRAATSTTIDEVFAS